jgi:protein required for attachment to host cells
MSQYLVTAIDGETARFFTLESADPESERMLVEHEGLVSPERGLQGDELWANTKSGRNRGMGGQAHSYDDHRQNHRLEFERRFAQAIATKLLSLVQKHEVQKLILIAEPQILGLMRDIFLPQLPKQLKVSELVRNLCHLKPHELHEYLAEKRQLPARKAS